MPNCATCLHLRPGRRVVRCGAKWAPREALPYLETCDKWERADDALTAARPATHERGPWSLPEAPGVTGGCQDTTHPAIEAHSDAQTA